MRARGCTGGTAEPGDPGLLGPWAGFLVRPCFSLRKSVAAPLQIRGMTMNMCRSLKTGRDQCLCWTAEAGPSSPETSETRVRSRGPALPGLRAPHRTATEALWSGHSVRAVLFRVPQPPGQHPAAVTCLWDQRLKSMSLVHPPAHLMGRQEMEGTGTTARVCLGFENHLSVPVLNRGPALRGQNQGSFLGRVFLATEGTQRGHRRPRPPSLVTTAHGFSSKGKC